jgi:hypothetical protein
MTVDHFRPRDRYKHLLLSWENLYYSCWVCNSHYKKNHPTEHEEAEGLRFVDPCNEDPDDHYRLTTDPRTGERCVVRALSPAAEFSVRILRLNTRKSLRDFWRELHQLETRLQRRLANIERLLRDVQSEMTNRGESVEFENIHTDYLMQRNECLQRLQTVLELRPFPGE